MCTVTPRTKRYLDNGNCSFSEVVLSRHVGNLIQLPHQKEAAALLGPRAA